MFQTKAGWNGLLAGVAVIAAAIAYGWIGLLASVALVVFWGVLRFNRASRLMRDIAHRPRGKVSSVVKMQAQLNQGMSMDDVLRITHSLGEPASDHGDWRWSDEAGNEIVVVVRRDVVVRWHATYAIDNQLSQLHGLDDIDPFPTMRSAQR